MTTCSQTNACSIHFISVVSWLVRDSNWQIEYAVRLLQRIKDRTLLCLAHQRVKGDSKSIYGEFTTSYFIFFEG